MNLPSVTTILKDAGLLSGLNLARWWTHVEKTESCWLWIGAISPANGGYGQFRVGGTPGRLVRAHIFGYLALRGDIPAGYELDHRCHDPLKCAGGNTCPHRRCVNPNHLEPVTHRVNQLRGNGAAGRNARKTHCPQGHEYNAENTIERRGRRECRLCVTHRDAGRKR